MKFNRLRSKSEEVFINLTPLIDVVFLLLIFFMVTTTFATVRHGIKVELPKVTIPQEKVQENVVISITKDNQIYIGGTLIRDERNILNVLRQEISKKGELIVINADKEVKHGRVVEMMDLAKRAGAVQLGILTTPEQRN